MDIQLCHLPLPTLYHLSARLGPGSPWRRTARAPVYCIWLQCLADPWGHGGNLKPRRDTLASEKMACFASLGLCSGWSGCGSLFIDDTQPLWLGWHLHWHRNSFDHSTIHPRSKTTNCPRWLTPAVDSYLAKPVDKFNWKPQEAIPPSGLWNAEFLIERSPFSTRCFPPITTVFAIGIWVWQFIFVQRSGRIFKRAFYPVVVAVIG